MLIVTGDASTYAVFHRRILQAWNRSAPPINGTLISNPWDIVHTVVPVLLGFGPCNLNYPPNSLGRIILTGIKP